MLTGLEARADRQVASMTMRRSRVGLDWTGLGRTDTSLSSVRVYCLNVGTLGKKTVDGWRGSTGYNAVVIYVNVLRN